MSYDDPQATDRGEQAAHSIYWIYFIVVPLLGVVGFVLVWIMSLGGSRTTTQPAANSNRVEESSSETARQSLSRQTDLNACRGVLQQINTELGEKSDFHPPALTNEQKDWLRGHLTLDNDELREIESSSFTRLDAHHLFRCFLMRDVANALEIKGVRGKIGGQVVREKPLDQAVRAFAWVMRQVRLRPGEEETEPPSFVVRRGWGTALDRALIFLALLEQLGDPDAPEPELLGFLLQVPPLHPPPERGGKRGGATRVCGRAVSWSATARRSICSIPRSACRCPVPTARASPPWPSSAGNPNSSRNSTLARNTVTR